MAQAPDKSKQKNRNRLLGNLQLAFIAGLVIIALLLARAPDRVERSVNVNASVENSTPQVVSVLSAPEPANFTQPINLTGNVTLEETIVLMSEAQGRVVWISEKFRHGKTILANEVIAKIDPTKYQLRVKEIETRLRLQNSKLAAALNDGDEDRVTNLQTRIELLETRLELAKLQLSQTELSLPYDINVTHADIAVGELVGPFEHVGPDAAVLGKGYRNQDIRVAGPIEPHRVQNLEPLLGRPAQVNVQNMAYPATLVAIANTVSPKTRMVRLFFEFTDNSAPETLPLPGMFAEIEFDGATFENVFILPLRAMQSNSTAWVIENDVLASRTPNTLAVTTEHWIVEPFDVANGLVVGHYPGIAVGTQVTAEPLD